MIDQKLINRINELAAISKQRALTIEEENERKLLRNEYLKQLKNDSSSFNNLLNC